MTAAKPKQIVYARGVGGHPTHSKVVVDGLRFFQGKPVDVEDSDLAKELLSGDSERLKGFQFEELSKYDPEATAPDDEETPDAGSGDKE